MKDDKDMREPIVHLAGVTLKLESEAGSVNILRGINLKIDAGETVSVVGPSGSGKTSMLMLIGGLERQTEGDVKVAGHDLSALDEDKLARFRRDNVGIVFQNFHLVPTMNALENVAIPVELAGVKDPFDRARSALASVGLDHRLSHYPGQLSGGEQQMLAMMGHPNIATLIEAGITEDGRPFFAMELVKGSPITKYCDERRLSIQERLEVFVDVCLAVNHAHQKGAIHRDLKPSNILVFDDASGPIAKVIDFGISQATKKLYRG